MCIALACLVLSLARVAPAGAQSSGGGAHQLDAPAPPGGVAPVTPAAQPPMAAAPSADPLPPPLDPHPRRGMAGIIVGWSGVGAALANFALMGMCGPLFDRASDSFDIGGLDQGDGTKERVESSIRDGARICRIVYGAFAATSMSVGMLGLTVGYARRHRYLEAQQRAQGGPGLRLSLQPALRRRGGAVFLIGSFR